MHFEEPFVIFHIFSTPPAPEQGSADFFTFIFIVPQFRRKTIWTRTNGTDGQTRVREEVSFIEIKTVVFIYFFLFVQTLQVVGSAGIGRSEYLM